VVSFTPRPLYYWGKTPPRGTPLIGGWVVLRACLDAVGRRKISLLYPFGESNPGHAAGSVVTVVNELPYKQYNLLVTES